MAKLKPFWRRTPPALFPSLLGLFGLALAWRAASSVWDVTAAIGVTIGVIATLILIVTLTSYVVKLLIRPMVLWEDLQIGPARGSVSAGSMCAMALAVFLLPYTSLGAFLVWWMSVALHAVYFVCVLLILMRHKNTFEEISPVLMLPIVGVLVSTLAAPTLGYGTFSLVVLLMAIPLSAAILMISLWNARTHGVPAAQRSSYAILLAPPSVTALGIYALSGSLYYLPVWICASLVGIALLPFVRWMGQGGWSPAWGAFTFPISAFAGVQIYATKSGFGLVAEVMAVGSLTVATVIVPYIVARTYLSWFQGKLGPATKAAVA
jgi:tellurite resistance protein